MSKTRMSTTPNVYQGLVFELGKKTWAARLPGCFLSQGAPMKKGFPGTDTELTRHFVTLFAEQRWWGVSIYTSGYLGCPDTKFGMVGRGLLIILYSGCNNCFCIFIQNLKQCRSSTDGSPQNLSLHSIHIHGN